MTALVTVMGVLDPDEAASDDLDECMRQHVYVDCDKYVLVWETEHLRRFGGVVKLFHHSSMQVERSSSVFPIAPMVCGIGLFPWCPIR